MASLDDVYRQFGETAEAAQLLEVELGNIALMHNLVGKNLFLEKNTDLAASIFNKINKSTLGQLLKQVGKSTNHIDEVYSKLENALKVRNRLSHSFYREHNFRRNTEDGCSIMLKDLINMHDILLEAYRELLDISNSKVFDFDIPIPKSHVNIQNLKTEQINKL